MKPKVQRVKGAFDVGRARERGFVEIPEIEATRLDLRDGQRVALALTTSPGRRKMFRGTVSVVHATDCDGFEHTITTVTRTAPPAARKERPWK